MQVFAMRESKAHVLTCGTLENYYESSLPSIENMINSFEFTKSTSSDNIIYSEILQPNHKTRQKVVLLSICAGKIQISLFVQSN